MTALLLVVGVLVRRETPPSAPIVTTLYPEEFDVIVIGGGPAGSVVSKLLSDDPTRRVLLIEAGDASQVELGGDRRIDAATNIKNFTPFDVPFFWTSVANTRPLHWEYPDVNVARALGGCGIHNAMLYVRAIPSDLKRWNMPTWTWEKALEIYMQMESFDGPNVPYHGTSGPVRTSPPSFTDELSKQFLDACEEIGVPRTADFNAPGGRYGAGFYHFNTREGVRESAARRFLGPIFKERRPNFMVMLNTIVKKIHLNEDATRATGVDVEGIDGTLQTVHIADGGQVVVTAGAINTPKVLMQSGLGHADDLNLLEIPVKKHLPRVGMNLQDHPVLALSYENPIAEPLDLQQAMNTYFNATLNPNASASSFGLMGSAGISAGAFLIPPGGTIPEIQLTFFPRKSEPHVSKTSTLDHSSHILITVALLHPSARNRVILTTEDEKEYIPRVMSEVPAEEPEHLQPDDVRKLTWGVSVAREIAAALARKGAIGTELLPGPAVTTTDDVMQWVPNAVFRNSHWVGSASMGNSAEDGVVDYKLRVFGVDNLRVADASVIPKIPNGNVHSSVLMVASHAAELIRADFAAAASG